MLAHALTHLAPILDHLASALGNQLVQLAIQVGLQAWVGGG